MGWFDGKKDKQIKALMQANARLQLYANAPIQANYNQLNYQTLYPSWDINRVAERYCTIDDLYSIIKRLASTSALIPSYAYSEKPEAKKYLKQLKSLRPGTKPYIQKALQLKALDDLPDSDPVNVLLQNPSDTLGKYEFYETLYAMLLLHGEAIIYKEKGIVGGKPRKLHILYPQHVQLLVTQTYPQQITGYRYSVDGHVVAERIEKEDVIHIRYFNPNYSITGNELRGLSPVKVLLKRLTTVENSTNITNAQLKNGGVPGVLFDKSPDVSKEVSDARKENFARYLAAVENKGGPFVDAGEMGWLPMGLPLVDMEVIALEKVNFKKLCNAYSVSDTLFNNDSASTESNVKEMRKALYTDACLPNVQRVNDALEMSLNLDFKDKTRVIHADTSEIPELQEDYKDLATWLGVAWWVTPNEKREMMKFDKLENPLFNEPLLPTGLQMLGDLIIPEPIEAEE